MKIKKHRRKAFENNVFRMIFGSKGHKDNNDVYCLYPSPNIINVIHSRRMRGVECTGKKVDL